MATAAREPPTEEMATPAEEALPEIRAALEAQQFERAAALAGGLHAADQADVLELLDQEDRLALVAAQGEAFVPEVLTFLDDDVRREVIDRLGADAAGVAIAGLDVDDAVEILSDLPEDEQLVLLETLPRRERQALEEGLAYPEDSAGRLMQRRLVAVPEYWTVGQTIDFLRANPNLPDDFYDIYTVDPRFRPVGSVPLSRMLRSKRDVHLSAIAHGDLHTVAATMDQEEVGYMFRQYGLASAPVVGPEGRLLGVITVDDVVHVIQEEAEEDILKLGGVAEPDTFAKPWRTGMRRLPWLVLNLITAIVASLVISNFEGAIGQLVALAVLMPIVASMGGNAGTQTLTVVVRALAVHELTGANALRVFGKEFVVGLINGGAFLVIGAITAVLWYGDPMLAAIFGAAMVINLAAAAAAGVLIPFVLDRLGLDPALASGVFLTTVTDVVGFFSFLGLATLYLL